MASTYLLLSLLMFFISFGCSCVPEQNPTPDPLKAHRSRIREKTRFKGFYWLEHGLERSIMRNIRKEEREEPPLRTERVVNVDSYGAIGDGITDDTEAFAKAWNEACSSSFPQAVLLVPEDRKYLLRPIAFNGACVSHITVLIKGTLIASSNRSLWDDGNVRHWILFDGVRNLVVKGGGTISGNGQIWWRNSCKINKTLPCTGAPTAMTFSSCRDLKVENLRFKDSQKAHVSFEGCTNVAVSKLLISAPGNSPNTDGIHVAETKNMIITECVIRTGDDCISIVSGSRNVKGMNIVCGPGHGISIGSLGANNTVASVRTW
ncbi:polygalacturonase-like [Iris pallida]|uniref:Polygalacturonase-like n=1 Tax=Iris pallida TaxID=29817 RepID=A0AAX6F626_IRIPA|nr:polygalacturonase-like [Iris pallida]